MCIFVVSGAFSPCERIDHMKEFSKPPQQHQNASIEKKPKVEQQHETSSTLLTLEDNGNLNVETCKFDLPLEYCLNIDIHFDISHFQSCIQKS